MAGSPVRPSSQSGSQFSQQGQLDWLALARAPVTYSVEVLARYGQAGVEAITVAMGQAICLQFDLKPITQTQLDESLAKLKTFTSYGRIAWFGFGLKHILDDLCSTEQGTACVALCGCLTASYDTNFSSKVLRHLCNVKGAPSKLTPSLRQWRALVEICAGSLAESQFPHLLLGFERLLNLQLQDRGCPSPPDPEILARAICILGELSQ